MSKRKDKVIALYNIALSAFVLGLVIYFIIKTDGVISFHSNSVDSVEYYKSSLRVYDTENQYIVIDVDTFMKYPKLQRALEIYEIDFGYNVDITDVISKENNIKFKTN